MNEQFSDNVRAILERSEIEAASLDLAEVSSELVLLALAAEEGTAAHVLRALNITPDLLHDHMPRSTSAKATPRPIPFGASAVHAVNAALHEAARMGHGFVGTEHLLLGVLSEPTGRASTALNGIGRDAVVVRERLLDLLVSPGFVSPEAPAPPAFEPRAFEPQAPAAETTIDLREPYHEPDREPDVDPPPVVDDVPRQPPAASPSDNGRYSNGEEPTAAHPGPGVATAAPTAAPAADESNAVVTALLGEMVLLRAELAALRSEIVAMRSVRH